VVPRKPLGKQLAIIAELEHGGHNSAAAKELLAILHKSQHMHEDHWERILRVDRSIGCHACSAANMARL
jgi:hypothetical protein